MLVYLPYNYLIQLLAQGYFTEFRTCESFKLLCVIVMLAYYCLGTADVETLRPSVSKQKEGCSHILNNTLIFEMWADHCKSSPRHVIFCFSNHQVQCKLHQMWSNISAWSASWLALLISTHTPHIYGYGLVLYIIGNSTLLLTQFQTTFPSLKRRRRKGPGVA
jgi:hypothetical protein